MRALLSAGMASQLASLAAPGTLVVLDFDGTLAPIVADRRAAALTPRTRALLARLARLYPVAVLSGRGAPDVRARVEGLGIRWVVGSHGAEWPGETRRHLAWRRRVGAWRAALVERLAGVDGLELEVKPRSLAVHYRRAGDPAAALARIFLAMRDLPGAAIVPGKKVVNLLPGEAGDKGTALRRLVGVAKAERVLFVGDDVTDEAAFAAVLEIPAITARVGRDAASQAGTFLPRRADVDLLLARLCELREPAPTTAAIRPRGAARPLAPADALGPAMEFMKELWRLEQGLNRRSKAMLNRHGVTGPQRLVVRVVARLGPIRPAELARVLHLHPSSITRLVHRLEARHLVRRTADPTHAGRFLLELGARGRSVERLGVGTVESAVRAALAAAAPGDVEATRRVIALVTRRLAARR